MRNILPLIVSSLCLVHVAQSSPVQNSSAQHNSARQSAVLQPTWDEMTRLIGQPIEGRVVQQFVKKYGLSLSSHKGDTGSYSNYDKMPMSLLFRQNKIERVVVATWRSAGENGEKWPVYLGQLPLGLQRSDTIEKALQRLGAPESRSKPVQRLGAPADQFQSDWLNYQKRGLWLTFNHKSKRLREIDIDDPSR